MISPRTVLSLAWSRRHMRYVVVGDLNVLFRLRVRFKCDPWTQEGQKDP